MSVKTYYRKVINNEKTGEYYVKFKNEKLDMENDYWFYNYGTQKPDGSIDGYIEGYMFAGGGCMDGCACKEIVKKQDGFYWVDYRLGHEPEQKLIGTTIIWTTDRQKDGTGEFWIV